MIDRRNLLAVASSSILAGHAFAQPLGPVHALCVGINDYEFVSKLTGCENDVDLVGERLRQLGAKVTTLKNAQVTRSGFDVAWQRSTAAAAPGDTFIFHYAGHGQRVPVEQRPSPQSTLGDFLLFRSYHPREKPDERLVDSELHHRLIALHRRGIAVVVLLDCCFAGSLTRSPAMLDGLALRTPNVSTADILAGLANLPPPPPAPPPAALEPILFYAAGLQNQAVPEVISFGQPHGALSVGFAQAVSGAADRDGDGILTRGELFDHIRFTSQALASSRQEPIMQPEGRREEPVLRVSPASPNRSRPAATPVRMGYRAADARGAETVIRRIPGVTTVLEGWDLFWDLDKRQVVGPSYDVFAYDLDPAYLPSLIERVRLERRLADMATTNGAVSLRLMWPNSPKAGRHDNEAHPRGRFLVVTLSETQNAHVLLFNIASATLQLLSPQSCKSPCSLNWSKDVGYLPDHKTASCVSAPFGSDLVVGVVTDKPAVALGNRLNELHGKPLPPDFTQTLEASLTGLRWRIGLQTIVTVPGDDAAVEPRCRQP